ncbi:LOW QUALITY PROTEIN: hypothetical protein PHPALM_28679 [Phytophthora palmivora]|uniref:MULE transposase domain-containing protein n=1 Tax=Phytophthora palmivora TaxID=4796 RepID=A0A2P4X9H4_9STRA|nr:LOW QUALITY PROTEIN: hypothetical protein PHPALM_28679 [Phytophthora palmivora]
MSSFGNMPPAAEVPDSANNVVGSLDATERCKQVLKVAKNGQHATIMATNIHAPGHKTISYRCSKFRQGCRGTMEFTISSIGFFACRPHTCRFAITGTSIADVTDAMTRRVDTLAIELVTQPARHIWETLRDEFYGTTPVGIFVPVTSRSGDSYWDIVHFIVQGTDQQIEPTEFVCDFESALIHAVQTQFPIIVGCLFNQKQALRRAMKQCGIAMTRGVIDVLTVLEHSLVEQGTKWVKHEICQRCDAAGQYDVSVWNVFWLSNELIARTNKPIERVNRESNDRFPKSRPSMTTFVGVIKTLSAKYLRRLADVSRCRSRRVVRETIQLPIPANIPSGLDDDSDDDEHLDTEQPSDNSSNEEDEDTMNAII